EARRRRSRLPHRQQRALRIAGGRRDAAPPDAGRGEEPHRAPQAHPPVRPGRGLGCRRRRARLGGGDLARAGAGLGTLPLRRGRRPPGHRPRQAPPRTRLGLRGRVRRGHDRLLPAPGRDAQLRPRGLRPSPHPHRLGPRAPRVRPSRPDHSGRRGAGPGARRRGGPGHPRRRPRPGPGADDRDGLPPPRRRWAIRTGIRRRAGRLPGGSGRNAAGGGARPPLGLPREDPAGRESRGGLDLGAAELGRAGSIGGWPLTLPLWPHLYQGRSRPPHTIPAERAFSV
ncbi:MAG: hypothetical protein AVDCRST_MAG03-913, partial [uncultured Rubrobacteraceae bacterium]